MRTWFQVLSVLFFVFGAPATLLGVVALLYAKLAPVQPAPSLNEGPGMAGFLGFFVVILGSVSLALGFATLAGVRALSNPRSTDWARKHRRFW